MIFAPDTEVTLQWAATLVNTKPTVGAPETLNTVADLLEHMAGWSWTGSMPDHDTDLAQVRRGRDRLRTLWDVDVDQAVDIVNALLRDGRALPTDDLPEGDPAAETASGDALDPAVAAVLRDDQRILWRHIGALSTRCQALLRIVAFVDRPDYVAVSEALGMPCLLYTSPSPRDRTRSRMPSSA